jgi:rhamnose transport system permease protein
MNRFSLTWDKGIALLLVAVTVLGSFGVPYFGSTDNISFILQDIGEITLIAFAMSYLIIAGEIDLSVASALNLSSATIGVLFKNGVPFGWAVVGGLLTGLACGLINGFLVTVVGLQSLAVTIGTLALYRGLCFALLGNNPVNQMPDDWTSLGYSNIEGTFFPYVTILLVVFGALFWVVLHYTQFGRRVFAIGINPEAAKFSGIPVARTKMVLFALTGLMSGVAGVVYTLRFASASPDGAVGYELAVIAAVLFGGVSIAGGVGTLWGVLASVLVLGVVRSVLQLSDFSANALLIVSGALLLISVVFPRASEMIRAGRKAKSSN